MTEPDSALGKQFHREMVAIYQTAKGELGYNATYFLRMLSEEGGVETAKRLVATPTPSDGFTTLYERGRLDLTVEALVLKPQYAELFPENLVEAARNRLADYGWTREQRA